MAGKDKRANGTGKRANGSAPDDAEFEKLLDEMDELGRQADALRKKVNHLIDEMRENDVPLDEEADGVSGDADNATDEQAVDEQADHEAVNENANYASSEENEAGDGDVALEADHEPDPT